MKVPAGWDLPVTTRAQLAGDRFGRQREIVADEHLVLVLHRVPDRKASSREGAYFWRNPAGEWRTTLRGKPTAALREMIKEYEDAVVKLEQVHENADSASSKFSVLERLGPLGRAVRNFSDALSRARESLESGEAKQDLQPFVDQITDAARSCELLQLDARNALDFHIARQSEIQAAHSREVEKATHRLNTMATVFLPLTAVASMFGMNLSHGLEGAAPWVFWSIMCGSIVAGLFVSELLAAFRTRRHANRTS